MVIWAVYRMARHRLRAIGTKAGVLMDILLHLGAHRCATTNFQAYLDLNRDLLQYSGLEIVTPGQTRSGLMRGLLGVGYKVDGAVRRGQGRVALQLAQARQAGAGQVLISEENILGAMGHNLRQERLYPLAQHRLAGLFRPGLAHRVRRIGLSLRSYDSYWAAALSFAVMMGRRLPDQALCDRLVTQPRRWRDVIWDIAQAFPQAKLAVWRFEDFAAWPECQLAALRGAVLPTAPMQCPVATAPVTPNRNQLRMVLADRGETHAAIRPGIGQWMPFDAGQRTAMRAQYQADVAWLESGADGLATYFIPAAQNKPHRTTALTGAGSDAFPPNSGGYHGIQRQMG